MRLAALYGVAPGSRAVVATVVRPRARGGAWRCTTPACELAAVADLRDDGAATPLERADAPRRAACSRGTTVLEARGPRQVLGASCSARPAPATASGEHAFGCDLLVVSGGSAPATSLLTQAGARTGYDARLGQLRAARSCPTGVHAAGEVAGAGAARRTPSARARVAGRGRPRTRSGSATRPRERAADERERLDGARAGPPEVAVPPAVTSAPPRQVLRLPVRGRDRQGHPPSVEEGYDSIELSKRYTTTTMGPCQGRMCQLPAVRLMAEETGQSLEQTSAPRPRGRRGTRCRWARSPGARSSPPSARRSTAATASSGANVLWAGDWRRAYDYGDPQAEALAVHEAAGLIDVSTLGKLIVRGPDAGEFLDRLYPNRFSNLKPGRIRYGVIASDAGRIIDDGTICRLDDDSFYVTTTSSGAGAVYEWFSWWLADWGLRRAPHRRHAGALGGQPRRPARAGDHGRAHRPRLLAPRRFTYLDGKRAEVAGVPCLILRIGFVGEVGYELHFPAAHGEHLWDALLEAGRRARAAAVRARAPAAAAPPEDAHPHRPGHRLRVHAVRRGDAVDRQARQGPGLHRQVGARARGRGRRSRPRSWASRSRNGHVPTEGAVVLPDGDGPVGQVTSARFSPQLGGVIGMAWVPAALAKDGATVTISDEGRRLRGGRWSREPFYDPDGEVLRS